MGLVPFSFWHRGKQQVKQIFTEPEYESKWLTEGQMADEVQKTNKALPNYMWCYIGDSIWKVLHAKPVSLALQ